MESNPILQSVKAETYVICVEFSSYLQRVGNRIFFKKKSSPILQRVEVETFRWSPGVPRKMLSSLKANTNKMLTDKKLTE